MTAILTNKNREFFDFKTFVFNYSDLQFTYIFFKDKLKINLNVV